MLNLRIEDKDQNLAQQLADSKNKYQTILHNIRQGEEQYKESLGWLHTAQCAGENSLERIQALADKI